MRITAITFLSMLSIPFSCSTSFAAHARRAGDVLGPTLTITAAAGTQKAAAVAYNPDCDRFLVVWQDRRNGIDDDIWGCYVDGAGGATLGTFNLTPGRAGNQSAPSIAYEPNQDDFLVVWMDDQDGNWDVYGQTFNCAKAATSPLIPIATEISSQQYPDVDCAYDLAWVVWQDRRNGNLDVYGQILAPGGVLDGPNVNVSAIHIKEQSYPAIAMNPRADTGCSLYSFLVAWRDLRAGTLDVYSHQLNDEGRCGAPPDTAIYTGPATQSMPDLVYGTAADSDDDRYLVVWQDQRGGTYDVYGRLVLPSGLPVGASGPIANAGQDQKLPAVAYSSSDDQFLCVYEDWSAGNAHVIGRRVSLGGALVGVGIPFATTAGSELAPAIAWGSIEDHYLVVWERAGNIYARAYWN